MNRETQIWSEQGASMQQVPTPDLVKWCEKRYTRTFKNYAAFHAWVVANPAEFWAVIQGFYDAKGFLTVEKKGEESPCVTLYRQERPAGKKLSAKHERLAKKFIAENLDKNVNVGEMARYCGLSKSYFTRAFKQATGMSPHYFQTYLRIEKSKELLANERYGICEIATTCGFADQSHFNRRFRLLTGTTPGVWRIIRAANT